MMNPYRVLWGTKNGCDMGMARYAEECNDKSNENGRLRGSKKTLDDN